MELTTYSCLPADAMWNLAMASNVYLTVFKKYNAERLKSMEWIYLLVCYGLPLIPAFAYCFISRGNDKIYGNATLWCWVSGPWDWLRVALCYAPAWYVALLLRKIMLTRPHRQVLHRHDVHHLSPRRQKHLPQAPAAPIVSAVRLAHLHLEPLHVLENHRSLCHQRARQLGNPIDIPPLQRTRPSKPSAVTTGLRAIQRHDRAGPGAAQV